MKRIFLPLFLVSFLLTENFAQSDSSVVVFANSQVVESGRYNDYLGSPYLFDHFVLADIVSSNIDVYNNIAVNYNGHTNGFEARKGFDVIELDERWYLRVEINPEINPDLVKEFGKEKLVFQRGIHPKLQNTFALVLYVGTQTVLAKTFVVSLAKNKVEEPGKTREVKRFRGKFVYHLIKNGQLNNLSLRKKAMLKTLDNSKEVESFVKKNDINFRSEADLIKLVEFYDKSLMGN